ncbi:MAG: M20 family peptidase, partial [Erysipelotrichaceae bacterium]|nr:M20 family peptidase [Erysipelotrichaceae bacterium]
MNERVLEYLNGYRDEIFSDLMTLVNKEACTSEVQGLQEVRECLKTIIEKRTGLAVTEHVAEHGHNVLSFSYGKQKESIVFVGHYDTVHPAGSFPVKTEGNKLYGPGVYDMKSGLVAG